MFCQFCGTQLRENAGFCKSCGRATGEAHQVSVATSIHQPPVQPQVRVKVVGGTVSDLRWGIIALVAIGWAVANLNTSTFNYVLFILERDFYFRSANVSLIYLASYLLALLVAGLVVGRISTKKAGGISGAWWSLASIGHVGVSNYSSLLVLRVFRAVGGAVYYVTAMKAISEWLPKVELSVGIGILLAAEALGQALHLPVLRLILPNFGWQRVVIVTSLLGIAWLIVWISLYRDSEHVLLTNEEIGVGAAGQTSSDRSPGWHSWIRLFMSKEVWGVMIAALAVGISRDSLSRLIFHLDRKFGFENGGISGTAINTIGGNFNNIYLPMIMIGGAIGSGYLCRYLVKSGKSIDASRKIAVWAGAILITAVWLIKYSDSMGIACLGYAASTFGIWFMLTPLYTLPLDLFESNRVASVAGLIAAFVGLKFFLFKYLFEWGLADTYREVGVIPAKPLIFMSVLPILAALLITLLIPRINWSDDQKM